MIFDLPDESVVGPISFSARLGEESERIVPLRAAIFNPDHDFVLKT
jgi:hypothetical protein